MRIVSGTHKGRRIQAPKNLPVRPTTDIGKEALFNILTHRLDFDEIRALDLFSGTGNISYELASRGVADVTAVDADANCVKFIRKTSGEFEFPIHVVASAATSFLKKASGTYDLIFADPPYDMNQSDFEMLVMLVFERNLLAAGGIMVIEHSRYTKMEALPHFSFQRSYGGAYFTFFEIPDDDSIDENT